MEYLPSKRFGITAVFILAAFAGWFFIFGPGKDRRAPAETPSPNLISIETAPTEGPEGDTTTPTEENERYLRLEGIEFLPSRLATSDETASSTVASKKYGIELAQSLTLYGQATRLNEVQLLLRALEKGSAAKAQTELLGLRACAQAHGAVRAALTAQHVPQSFKGLHAALVTSVSRIEQLARNMQEPFTDPVLALASAEGYVRESAELKRVLTSINNEFSHQGITFSDTEKATVILYEVQ